jgi:hypothetical protein
MDALWKKAVQENRCDIIGVADAYDNVLDRITDHFVGHNETGLLPESVQEIKTLTNSKARMRKFLDFLLDRGPDISVFHVFCDALRYAKCDSIAEKLLQSYKSLEERGNECCQLYSFSHRLKLVEKRST